MSLRDVAATCRMFAYFFNWKAGLISAAVNGPVVAYANWNHSVFVSVSAGVVQGVVSFGLTALTAGIAQRISDSIERPLYAYAFGSVVPATVTFLVSYGAHVRNETPELFESVLWPTLLSFSTSIGMNALVRNYELLPNWLQWCVRRIVMRNKKIS